MLALRWPPRHIAPLLVFSASCQVAKRPCHVANIPNHVAPSFTRRLHRHVPQPPFLHLRCTAHTTCCRLPPPPPLLNSSTPLLQKNFPECLHIRPGIAGVTSEDGQLARIGGNVKTVRMPGCKEGHGFGGVKVGARRAHVGQGLGVGISGSNGSRWSAATWLDNRAKVDADIPVSDAWELWNDRESIPRWMKWIDTVKVSKQKPDFSKWTLRYKAFGRDFEFSWLARNLEPVHHQKIHWQSVDGLPNRGALRFIPRGPKACTVELTISYELPDIVAPLGTAVSPIVDQVLQQDMDRFAKYTRTNQLSCL